MAQTRYSCRYDRHSEDIPSVGNAGRDRRMGRNQKQSGARKTVCPERVSRPLLSLPTCGVLERFAPKIVKGKRKQGNMKTHGPTVTTIAVCFTFLSPLIGILVAFLAAWLLGAR
jgi:hypothetical protein